VNVDGKHSEKSYDSLTLKGVLKPCLIRSCNEKLEFVGKIIKIDFNSSFSCNDIASLSAIAHFMLAHENWRWNCRLFLIQSIFHAPTESWHNDTRCKTWKIPLHFLFYGNSSLYFIELLFLGFFKGFTIYAHPFLTAVHGFPFYTHKNTENRKIKTHTQDVEIINKFIWI
jgi:hypothetical protein